MLFHQGQDSRLQKGGEDLLSELQDSELAQYKAELSDLQRKLEDAQRSAETASTEISTKQERINELQTELDIIMGVQRRGDAEFHGDGDTAAADDSADGAAAALKRSLRQAETRYSVALQQIASMQHDLWRHQALATMNADPSLADQEGLKAEVLRLRDELEANATKIKKLTSEIDSGVKEAKSVAIKSAAVSTGLRRGFSEMLKLYMLVCADLKETPSKQVSTCMGLMLSCRPHRSPCCSLCISCCSQSPQQ